MNYKCSYNNSTFPYNHRNKNKQPSYNVSEEKKIEFENEKNPPVENIFSGILSSILSPLEKMIGRKINFDDLLLVALIYLLYTEKENDNNILLLCLIFLLFN